MVSQIAAQSAQSAGLDALPARPPTPPRERQNLNDIEAKLLLDRHPLASRLTLQTPPSHSPGSAQSTVNSSRRSRKRVEFTVQVEYHDSPAGTGKENEAKHSTPTSSISSNISKPLKSILKPASSPVNPNPLVSSAKQGDVEGTTNLAVMLESAIKQLAGNDRDDKVDAYTMMVRALKTSTNLPDRIALQSKMSLFLQFIQRDITAKGANGAIDTSLTNHALTLLCTFLHFPAIASSVSSDFGVFIIDHCIRSFEDEAMAKDVVRHLMQVVVSQEFSPKVMSSDRVGRLVTALHNIENHMTGKSIVMSRILIFRKLVRQSGPHMVSHSDWLLDLFTDMMSSIKEIRAAAIALGLEVGYTVAKERQVTKKVQEILQMQQDEIRYAQWYAERLGSMAENKSSMAAVPQIWSVVVLLLRCPLERWEFFEPWLNILQRCFNSGDYLTKSEAIHAWSRLVYIQHLYPASFSKTAKTLCQPFNQLTRSSKQVDGFRKVIIGGICNIYYYAFKPNTSSANIDQYWDVCVKPIMRTLAFPEGDVNSVEVLQSSSSNSISQAASILSGLFDPSSVRIWKEDRVAENTLAKADDLPALDPKWVRRNAVRVFSVIDPILHRSFLELAKPNSDSSRLWGSLIRAVAAAGSKEVKVSADSAAFLGHALSLLMKIWTAGLGEGMRSAELQRSFLKATENYITTMVLSMGHLPFTERLLSMNKQNSFAPVSTPSHRSGKNHGPTRPPVHHLFSTLTLLPPGISEGEELSSLFKAVFEPFMLTRPTRSQRELAQELMQTPVLDGPVSFSPWVFIAEVLAAPMDHSQASHSSADSTNQLPIGNEFRDLVKHLHRGISHTPNLPWHQWSSLFQFAVEQATALSGEAGCSVAVVEPLAKAVLESFPAQETPTGRSSLFKCGAQLLEAARQPRDRQALDAARRRLWGTTVAGVRSASFDPFDNLYRLTCRLLETTYTTIDATDEQNTASLITETSHFLARASPALLLKSLTQLQPGIAPWIRDEHERYSSKHRPALAEAVKSLWDRVCNVLSDADLGHAQLDAIEQMLCCAFTSKHRHVVNSAVVTWNRGFENVANVEYPDALKDVLLSLRPYVDITLPGLDASLSGTHDFAPMFVDSQDDFDVTGSLLRSDQGLSGSLDGVPPSSRPQTPKPNRPSLPGSHKSEGLHSHPQPRSTRSSTRAKAAKLRHDDSQLQFAAIEEPSPSKHVDESQVLTDRQREVRERQLENAALFPAIRSSPTKDHGALPAVSRPVTRQSTSLQSPLGDRSATPKATRSFDYVSSTPTPRRGQASISCEDHEMTDEIPSSPPEPRRNLLPEMRPHSRNSHMLDDIPMSSSPVSGSPVAKPAFGHESHEPALQEPLDIVVESASKEQTVPSESIDVVVPPASAVSKDDHADEGPVEEPTADPPHNATITDLAQRPASPKSDTEIYVDALTSPVSKARHPPMELVLPVSSHQDKNVHVNNGSFEMSDGEERSMARLVVELDSRKCAPLPLYDASSPEKGQTRETARECITVRPEPEGGKAFQRKSQSCPPPSSVHLVTTEISQSQPSERRSRKKRKRGAERKLNGGGKRRRQDEQVDVEVVEPDDSDVKQEPTEQDLHEIAPGSPDLSCAPDNSSLRDSFDLVEDSDPDTAAVNLQLITEASQQSGTSRHSVLDDDDDEQEWAESEAGEDEEMKDYNETAAPDVTVTTKNIETPPPPPTTTSLSAVERITASLRDGLEGLRTATLSREDVYKIEDMFMDIKKELYEAERRSRQNER
ncbi:hypothetical protein GGS20DRAFT_274674 [Poronia punctata]|nr:hypothetical protein GGS20DRAFT_274674 [Poronia punctata]